jgi:hypothetical protein
LFSVCQEGGEEALCFPTEPKNVCSEKQDSSDAGSFAIAGRLETIE